MASEELEEAAEVCHLVAVVVDDLAKERVFVEEVLKYPVFYVNWEVVSLAQAFSVMMVAY